MTEEIPECTSSPFLPHPQRETQLFLFAFFKKISISSPSYLKLTIPLTQTSNAGITVYLTEPLALIITPLQGPSRHLDNQEDVRRGVGHGEDGRACQGGDGRVGAMGPE